MLFASNGFSKELQELSNAKDFDYCSWYFNEDPDGKPTLPKFQAVLDQPDQHSKAEILRANLIESGGRIAKESTSKKDCKKQFRQGVKTFEKAYKSARRQVRHRIQYSKTDPDIASIQENIHQLWMTDQAARQVYLQARSFEAGYLLWFRRLAEAEAVRADIESVNYMKTALQQYDWIDRHRFSTKISNHAWVLVQHADHHPEFQAMVLDRMAPYLENNGIKKANYAYLWDRVAVNQGRLQRYGTQPNWECKNGKLELQPMENPQQVNQRRAAFGLGDVQQDLDQMSQSACGAATTK